MDREYSIFPLCPKIFNHIPHVSKANKYSFKVVFISECI